MTEDSRLRSCICASSVLLVAPSRPRSVRARLVSAQQSLVEVSWREPAATNGIISQYTVSVRGSTSPNIGNDGIAINRVEEFNKVLILLNFCLTMKSSMPICWRLMWKKWFLIILTLYVNSCRHTQVMLVLPTSQSAILKPLIHFK